MHKYNLQKGMTLVETLVAIAIMSLLVLAAGSVMTTFSLSERRNRAIAETEWQVSTILYDIGQSARNASSISSPAVTATSTSLTLALSGVTGENPTVYSLSSGAVLVSKGGGASIAISGGTVTVTNLTFQNITASGTKGAVRVRVTASYVNTGGKSELNYSTTRYLTITLR